MDFIKWVFLLVLVGIHESKACFEVERSALLEFKAFVNFECSDGDHLLPSWKDDPRSDCCDWERVTCDPTTAHVIELSLGTIKNFYDCDCLWNISMLQDLDELLTLNLSDNGISGWDHNKGFENFPKLSKLKWLDLSGNPIQRNNLSFIVKLLSLEFLDLSYIDLWGIFPVDEIHGLSNLKVLLLSENNIEGSFWIKTLCGLLILEELDLQNNDFTIVPQCLENLTFLKLLDLSLNRINGQLPTSWISQLTSLKYFDIRGNNFQGVLLFSMFRNHFQLEVVAINERYSDNNCLKVEIEDTDWIPKFQLAVLVLSKCNLNIINHRVPNFLLYQRNLRYVDLSNNNLEGRILDWLLANNSRMQVLFLANNSFTGHLNTPLHPIKELRLIDISENQMQGMLPENVGIILPSLENLVLSRNAFRGNLPTSIGLLRNLKVLDLSHNKFEGQIPETIFNCTQLAVLKLSNNQFCENFFSPRYNWSYLKILELSDNNFTGNMWNVKVNSYDLLCFIISNNSIFGRVPTWIANMSTLMVFNLRHNYLEGELSCEMFTIGASAIQYVDFSFNFLSGSIPSCPSESDPVQLLLESNSLQLHLESNNFSGLILENLLHSSYMSVLNLRDNRLSGNIPDIICEVSKLKVLLLGKNHLSGFIPKSLCFLEGIYFIDVSHNFLSGSIPDCLGYVGFGVLNYRSNFSSISLLVNVQSKGDIDLRFPNTLEKKYFKDVAGIGYFIVYIQVDFLAKNNYNTYKGDVLDMMSGLDLTCNNLVGEIPSELGNLFQINTINLSHNHFIGSIPITFASLTQIESFDLSHNNLTEEIPFQLTQLTFLEVFSVAYYNLSGEIPYGKAQFGTFGSSNYEGNSLLCGQPLTKNCSRNNEPISPPTPNDDDGRHWYDIDLVIFFSSFAASFFIFFLGVIVFLYVNPYWRRWIFHYGEKYVLSCYYFVSDILFK